jgi:L-ribulose-5-phosphate 4-epimerase
VPVTEPLSDREIVGEYEENTGAAILRAFRDRDPASHPAVLVANHGPFTWGKNVTLAAHNAVILEALARTAYFTSTLNPQASPIGKSLHDRHYLRKHGSNSHYGQAKEGK